MSFMPERDDSGRAIMRVAATVKGWHYYAIFFEYKTSDGTLVCEDEDGNDLSSMFSVKRFDINGNETTTKADVCVDQITMKETVDFEVMAGKLFQVTKPTDNIRLHVSGGMFDPNDNPVAGYVKTFVRNMNLKFVEELNTDGRASKFMKHTTEGAPYPTNVFQFRLRHDAGVEHEICIGFEEYQE